MDRRQSHTPIVLPETFRSLVAAGFIPAYDRLGNLHFVEADEWRRGLAEGRFEGWSRRQ